jgi:hypothetical protein
MPNHNVNLTMIVPLIRVVHMATVFLHALSSTVDGMPFVSPIITEAAVNASQVTLVIQPLHVIKVRYNASFLKIYSLITLNI